MLLYEDSHILISPQITPRNGSPENQSHLQRSYKRGSTMDIYASAEARLGSAWRDEPRLLYGEEHVQRGYNRHCYLQRIARSRT